MKLQTALLLLLIPLATYAQKFQVLDAETKTPVSFATISFGDGKGTFAGEDGVLTSQKQNMQI